MHKECITVCCKSQGISSGIRRLEKIRCEFGNEIARGREVLLTIRCAWGHFAAENPATIVLSLARSGPSPRGNRRKLGESTPRAEGRLSRRGLPRGMEVYGRMRMRLNRQPM